MINIFNFNPLWKQLIDKGMTKEDLRTLLKTSPSTIAKMGKNQYVSMKIIDDICRVLNVKSISDIIEYIPDKE